MSGDIIRLDDRGVVLRYADPAVRRPHHDARQAQPDDLQRVAILKAERALIALETMVECADLSDAALDRIDEALQDIHDALQLRRREYRMYVEGAL